MKMKPCAEFHINYSGVGTQPSVARQNKYQRSVIHFGYLMFLVLPRPGASPISNSIPRVLWPAAAFTATGQPLPNYHGAYIYCHGSADPQLLCCSSYILFSWLCQNQGRWDFPVCYLAASVLRGRPEFLLWWRCVSYHLLPRVSSYPTMPRVIYPSLMFSCFTKSRAVAGDYYSNVVWWRRSTRPSFVEYAFTMAASMSCRSCMRFRPDTGRRQFSNPPVGVMGFNNNNNTNINIYIELCHGFVLLEIDLSWDASSFRIFRFTSSTYFIGVLFYPPHFEFLKSNIPDPLDEFSI